MLHDSRVARVPPSSMSGAGLAQAQLPAVSPLTRPRRPHGPWPRPCSFPEPLRGTTSSTRRLRRRLNDQRDPVRSRRALRAVSAARGRCIAVLRGCGDGGRAGRPLPPRAARNSPHRRSQGSLSAPKAHREEHGQEKRCSGVGTGSWLAFERHPVHSSWISQLAASDPSFFMVANRKRRPLSSPYQTPPPAALLRVLRANRCD